LILPDVNVLIGGYRADSPHYLICRPWLEQVISSGSPFAIAPLTLAAVIRITINPRAFVSPSKTEDVLGYCAYLLSHPLCRRLEAGDGHWAIFRKLCLSTNMNSKLVTDAWLAAIAIEHGCLFVTLDRGFAKFQGLRWSPPVMI
jgi:toxin-antitoxin system PIN domain toxin